MGQAHGRADGAQSERDRHGMEPGVAAGRSASLGYMTIAVCPGSFDPVTSGHLDVIERCARLFAHVHVLVAVNAAKKPMFTEAERVDFIRRALADDGFHVSSPGLDDLGPSGAQALSVTVASTDGLVTDYCMRVGAQVIVKGLRQNGDYEAELGMALVNRHLAGTETMFLPADPMREHISSSVVKDVALHGGDITGMVPDAVIDPLCARIGKLTGREG